MTYCSKNPRRNEEGFTLVELAIVMVIIGLLIGGILKGQELIANAKISATVSQLKSLDAAFNTFVDKYAVNAGDMPAPNTRLPNCAAAPCSVAGTGGTLGDGRIVGGNVVAAPAAGSEAGVAFVQLSAADLISGINPTGGATFGGQFPSVRAGGGLWVAYAPAAPAGTTLPGGKHYASLSGIIGTNTVATGAMNATTTAQIDRKIDDGRPLVGSVQTIGTLCFTGAGATAVYNEAANGGTCTLYTRVLN